MKISLNKINTKKNYFNYHYWNYQFHKLENSIINSGINNPITLLQKRNELIPVHGFRRIEIAKKLNLSEIPVKIYSDEKSAEKLFKESVLENMINTELNIYEKCKIIQILNTHFSDHDKYYWQKLLELPLDKKFASTINSILQFPNEWIEFFINKNVPFKRIMTFSKIKNIELLSKLLPLNIGLNKMEQMFQFLFEISQRDEINVKSILNNIDFEGILKAPNLKDKQDIVKVLYNKLYDLRYPLQSQYLKIIDEKVDKLKLPNNIKIRYDKTFERSGINFNINVNSKNDLHNSIKWLDKNRDKITNIIEKE
ncbi:MAG: ParB N-terminal domain-containing protein [Candidatus Marinimicrobia bacterium]|nr:ParB N-terminal domain-containing protein [Candidatus Neomarinimicrobiota bacterium]